MPGTLPNPGIEPLSFASPALAGGDSLPQSHLGNRTVTPDKWSRVRIKNSVLAMFEIVVVSEVRTGDRNFRFICL